MLDVTRSSAYSNVIKMVRYAVSTDQYGHLEQRRHRLPNLCLHLNSTGTTYCIQPPTCLPSSRLGASTSVTTKPPRKASNLRPNAWTHSGSPLRTFFARWIINSWPRHHVLEMLDKEELPDEFIREALPIALSTTQPMSNERCQVDLRENLLI
jgi:hypothetical protein